MPKGESDKQRQRRIRQEELREYLSKNCTVKHVIESIRKIQDLDEESEHFQNHLKKIQVANEQRIKLLGKYLPDLKAVELEGDIEHSGSLQITWQK